jgi:hypothetical protein
MLNNLISNERGSAIRFNYGKAPLQYLLWDFASDWLSDPVLRDAAAALGRFQLTRDTQYLHKLVDKLYPANQAALTAAAEAFAFGAEKYAPWNWMEGTPWSVPLASIGRHLLAEDKGELVDPESGLPHRAHVACNALMLLFYVKTYPERDDLPPIELFKRPDAGTVAPGDDEFVVVAGCRVHVSDVL